MLFCNFVFRRRSELGQQLGMQACPRIDLGADLYHRAVEQARLVMIDFHEIQDPEDMSRVQKLYYGYAAKPR